MNAGERPSKEREAELRALVAEHFDFIWRLLRRLGLPPADADDSTQYVFMTALSKLDRISPGSERTYLYGVALRVLANARRKLAKRREDPLEFGLGLADERLPPDRNVELGQAHVLLDSLLRQLPEELARVLVLAEIEGMTGAEIALLEGIPAGTAASRLRRARTLFQELIQQNPERNPFGSEAP
jgi:RNA polymerase sigma-70 factor, ECF subfamily